MSHLGPVGNKEHLWVLHVLQVLVTPHLSCPILQSPRLSNCSLCRSNSWPFSFSHHSLVFQFNHLLMGRGDQGKAPYTKAKQEPSESYFSLCPNNFFFSLSISLCYLPIVLRLQTISAELLCSDMSIQVLAQGASRLIWDLMYLRGEWVSFFSFLRWP